MKVSHYSHIAKAVETLLYPYAEIALHDLATNRIVAIFNPFSQRKAGDDSLLDTEDLQEIRKAKPLDVLGPYEKVNWDGRPLKSISAVLRNEKEKPIGLLCINIDVSHFQNWQKTIESFLRPVNLIAQPRVLFEDDWQERINQFVHSTLREKGKNFHNLSRLDKQELITLLEQEGAFNGKNAASYIGNLLGVSRATVYKVLSKHNGDEGSKLLASNSRTRPATKGTKTK